MSTTAPLPSTNELLATLDVASLNELFGTTNEGDFDTNGAPAAATTTINPAFMQEIKEVHTELWDALVELQCLCSRPLSLGPQCRDLLNRVKVIRSLLTLQFSLEESFGYFPDPLASDARICMRADALRREHRVLLAEFCRLAEQTQRWLDETSLAQLTMVVPLAYQEFFGRLQRHETAEVELIQEAWLCDIGAGD